MSSSRIPFRAALLALATCLIVGTDPGAVAFSDEAAPGAPSVGRGSMHSDTATVEIRLKGGKYLKQVDGETGKRVISDRWITDRVKWELLADNISKGFDVDVDTVNGVVFLKGTLANEDTISHVRDIAAKVEGVKRVDTSALVVAGRRPDQGPAQ